MNASSDFKSDAMPAILIEHARKDYVTLNAGKRTVVADVSFSVEQNVIHGLLGPNGAGKTTTLKMLLGLVRPTSGRFEILGQRSSRPKSREMLGFLPEQPYFSPQLTAMQAMLLYGRLSGLRDREIRNRGKQLLDQVGLAGRETLVLDKFSRGMLQRFGLAQAMIGSPRVLVLDEPASGLDPVGQRDVRNLMLSLRDSGTTVLLSSHQLSEVEAICDEVTILNAGNVAAKGDIDDLLNVVGQTSVRAKGEGGLPDSVRPYASDVAVDGALSVFSVADESVRTVVDLLDEAGWKVVSVNPKRDSLEDYFSRLLGIDDAPAEKVAS